MGKHFKSFSGFPIMPWIPLRCSLRTFKSGRDPNQKGKKNHSTGCWKERVLQEPYSLTRIVVVSPATDYNWDQSLSNYLRCCTFEECCLEESRFLNSTRIESCWSVPSIVESCLLSWNWINWAKKENSVCRREVQFILSACCLRHYSPQGMEKEEVTVLEAC